MSLEPIMRVRLGTCLVALVASHLQYCRTTVPETGLRHLEGDVFRDVPAFMWHAVPDGALEAYIAKKAGPHKVLPQDAPITKAVQSILDTLDAVARRIMPEEMHKVPRPVAVVLVSDQANAFVASRSVCVKQPAWKRTATAATAAPLAPDGEIPALDLDYPGYPSEFSLSLARPSSCELVEPEVIGWDVHKFVDLYNAKLPESLRRCRLDLENSVILIPDGESCGSLNRDRFAAIRFEAQANVVFFYTGLLKSMSPSSLAVVAAHELSHMYRAHTPYLLWYEPYFFLQTNENELRRPAKTDAYKDLRRKMLDASYVLGVPRTEGAKFDATLFEVAETLSFFLENHCYGQSPCKKLVRELMDVKNDPKFELVWGEVANKPLRGEVRDIYLAYEEALSRALEAIRVAELRENEMDRINRSVDTPLKKYFKPLSEFQNLLDWFESADRAISADLPNLRALYEEAARVGLGYYTDEEEADELAVELSAKAGLAAEHLGATWIEFMDAKEAQGYVSKFFETPFDRCKEWRAKGWQDEEGPVGNKLLIDSLADVHHGMCYRLYNTEREWHAHGFSNVTRLAHLELNQRAWKEALEESLSRAVDVAGLVQDDGNAFDRGSSRPRRKRHQCIFAPYRVRS